MPGVYIDLEQGAVIDVDTGRSLASIQYVTARTESEHVRREYVDGIRSVEANRITFITLELVAFDQSFADGFQRRPALPAPDVPCKMLPKID